MHPSVVRVNENGVNKDRAGKYKSMRGDPNIKAAAVVLRLKRQPF